MWPFYQVIGDWQWAVSWNMSMFMKFMNKHTWISTNFICNLWSSESVTTKFSHINQQVTNVILSFLFAFKPKHFFVKKTFIEKQIMNSFETFVGTPETVCPPASFKNKKLSPAQKHQRWCQWLAGLIDGDGCFLLSTKGYASLEITMNSKDETVLRQIQNVYGGSLKPRAGLNAVRYRLHHKERILKVCLDVNGLIRHSTRLCQFKKVCDKISLEVQTPDNWNSNHGWFAGIFDADGCIILNCAKPFPQITVSVTQKYKEIPQAFVNVFGGKSLL